MGLDITAYKNLTVVDNPQFDEDGELVNWNTEWLPGASMDWSERHFTGRGEGIESNKVYSWEDSFKFPAGSYSGYNRWRDTLNDFSERNDFYELIEFADNEGVIGFVVAKKLLSDFKRNYNKAIEYSQKLNDDGHWLSKYECWMKAFELASDNGAVDFH